MPSCLLSIQRAFWQKLVHLMSKLLGLSADGLFLSLCFGDLPKGLCKSDNHSLIS